MRSELLRGKTAQVSAEHSREVRALGAVRERAQRVGDRVRAQEDQFWKEISRVARAQKEDISTRKGGPALNLSRALDAHKLLSRVKDEQKKISNEVTVGVERVISSKVALTAFKKLERQARRRHDFRVMERQGEEVGEISTAARARRPRPQHGPREDVIARELTLPVAPGGVPMPPPVVSHEVKSFESAAPPSGQSPVKDLSIQSATVAGDRHEPTLRVQVESRGVPVACTLSSTSSGGVTVVVETPHQGIVTRVEQERGALAAKLSALGVRIGRLDIKRGGTFGEAGADHLPRRRRSLEERDENVIA